MQKGENMTDKYFLHKKNKYSKILIFALLIILTSIINIGNIEAKNRKAASLQVVRQTAVIKFNPDDLNQSYLTEDLGGDTKQKNMKFRWHKKPEGNEDFKIRLKEDLSLVSSSSGNSKRNSHGFKNFSSRDSIEKEAVLFKKKNEDNYHALDQFQKLMSKGQNDVELYFKLDTEKIAENWSDLAAGVYKAELEGNFNTINNPTIMVIVKKHIEINIDNDKKLNLDINDPTIDAEPGEIDAYEDTLNWNINNNINNLKITFASKGAAKDNQKSLTDKPARYFFRYKLESKNSKQIHYFKPSQKTPVNFQSGKLTIQYSTNFKSEKNRFFEEEKNREWYDLKADDYHDQVVITVEAE